MRALLLRGLAACGLVPATDLAAAHSRIRNLEALLEGAQKRCAALRRKARP